MKNSPLLIGLGIVALVIVGFLLFSQMDGNTTPVTSPSTNQTQTGSPSPMPTQSQTVIFKGTSPCADCPGISVVLTLKYDGTTTTEGSYTQAMTYQEKNVAPLTEHGSWKGLANDIIELTPSGANAQKQYYLQTQADTMEALGADKKQLPPPANYELKAG